MTLLAVVAVVAACCLAVLTWTQRRDARQRSAARVAALAAAIDGPLLEAGLNTRSHVLPLEAFTAEGSVPARRGWLMAAGVVPIAFVIAALLVTRGPGPISPPLTARPPESLELLDMRHDRTGDRLTVTGTVRVHGRHTAPVTAIVTGRDADGRIVSSARAPLDDASLDIDGESSFRVSVSGGQDVRRYQVRFETPLGPIAHVDRRATAATP